MSLYPPSLGLVTTCMFAEPRSFKSSAVTFEACAKIKVAEPGVAKSLISFSTSRPIGFQPRTKV